MDKTKQTEFMIENVTKIKGDSLFVKWKGYDNSFNRYVNLKDIGLLWVNIFLESYESFGEYVKVELGLLIYAKKVDLKGATGIDTCMMTRKTDLTNLKTKADDLAIDRFMVARED